MDHLEPQTPSEPALRLSPEEAGFFDVVADTADVWINTLDLEGRIVFWNRAAERISGYRREEVAGSAAIWEWLYPDPDYRAEIFQKASRILQQDEAILDLETTIRTRKGEVRIISWASWAMRDGQGGITGSMAIGRDVTEHRAVERDFLRVHAFQNLVLEHNVLGMAFVRERRIEWANPKAAEILGIPLEKLTGAPSRIIYPDDASYEDLGRKAYAAMARGLTSDQRVQLRRPNGEHFWCRLLGGAVDPARPHVGSVWFAEDVSALVAAESALAESEARFRGAFEGTQDALLLMTQDGFFDCNRRALELFGFAHKSELLRLQPADISPSRQPDGSNSRSRAMAHIQAAFKEGKIRFHWEHRTQKGELFPTEVLLSSFQMGRRKVLLGSVRDLRDRLHAEERDRESLARYRRMFEHYPDGMVILDTRNHEFVDFNPAILDMLRCTREEMEHIHPVDLSPERQPDGRSSNEKGLEMGRLALQNGSHRFLWTHRSPHRGDFVVEVLLAMLDPERPDLLFASWREVDPGS
jgi:PAS domain S-box-containing protein